MSLQSLCRSRVSLQRRVHSKDTSGGPKTTSWDTVEEDLAASVQPASGQIRMRYDQMNVQVSHTVYFALNLSVFENDRVILSDRIMKVQGVRPSSPEWDQWPCIVDVLEEPRNGI